eukprot:763300-Hanusia_phi.AAC.2
MQIKGYPTMLLFNEGKMYVYTGTRFVTLRGLSCRVARRFPDRHVRWIPGDLEQLPARVHCGRDNVLFPCELQPVKELIR